MGRMGLAFLLGHGCIHVLPSLPHPGWALLLVALALIAGVARSATLAALTFGMIWSWGHAAARLADDLPAALEGQDIAVRGHISSLPERSGADVRFTLDVQDPDAGAPKRVQLTWYRAPEPLAAGETWHVRVRLKRRNGFSNPGGFDYEGLLFRSGIGATGYVRSDPINQRVAPAGGRYPVLEARAWIAERMRLAAADSSVLGILQGLAIGDTREISAAQWSVFTATGTIHLMAISGLHVGMVAVMGAWFGGVASRWWPGGQARRMCAVHGQVVGGSLAALCYSMLAGLSVPTQRTLMMLCVYFGARWLRRESTIGNSLGLALLGVLLLDPFAPLAPGAWLSFGAVAVIVLAMAGRLTRNGKIEAFVRVQLAVTIGLAPLLLTAFGSVSVVSPLANAAAIPLFTLVIVPAILLGAGLSAVSTAWGGMALEFAGLLLEALWRPLQWLAQHPLALWHCHTPSPGSLTAMTIGAALLVLPGIWPLRLLGALLCSHVFLGAGPRPHHGDFALTVLDVGQGLAAAIRTERHVLLYDSGPAFRSGRDAGDLAVLPFLRSQGIRRLDTLIISHGDLDHRGGMETILASLPTERLLVGPSVEAAARAAVPCRAGDRWTWDGVAFEILHPAADFVGGGNDASCVLRVEGRAGSVLLTGDIEARGEQALIERRLPRADVVVVPHHGSRTSSSESFIAASAPQWAIFSAGFRNRWELPKEDIVARWRARGARTLNTAHSGAIEIAFTPDAVLEPREHRRARARYWSRPPSL